MSSFFFGAFSYLRNLFYLIYSEGDRWDGMLDYWVEVARTRAENPHLNNSTLDTPYITAELSAAVDRIALFNIHKFVEPEYLKAWLRSLIPACSKDDCGEEASGLKKGVFLLLMDRGCGKSAYTEKLNRLYPDPLTLVHDLDVRTYHISHMQALTGSVFERAVGAMWREVFQDTKDHYKAQPLRELEFHRKDDESPARALAGFLNHVRNATQNVRHMNRILFILDGLDEITPEASGLWDYIPTEDMLDDGVYILLTGRNPDEAGLPMGYRGRIRRLKTKIECQTVSGEKPYQRIYSISPQSGDNRTFLHSYIKETLRSTGNRYTDSDCDTIIALSDGRILYTRMYVHLLLSGKYELSILQKDKLDILPAYLNLLKMSYGYKGWQKLTALLTIFSSMHDIGPLSLDEIAWLLAESGPSFMLLSMISDISCLLNIARGYSVDGANFTGINHYRISNKQTMVLLLDYLKENDASTFYITTEGIVKRTLQLLDSKAPIEEAGYLLALSSIVNLTETFCKSKIQLSEEQLNSIVMVCMHFINNYVLNWKQHTLVMFALEQAIKGFTLLKNNQILHDENGLLQAYFYHGNMMMNLPIVCKASYDLGVEIGERLLYTDKLANKNDMVAMLNNRGRMLLAKKRYGDALADFERSVEIGEQLARENNLEDHSYLIILYHNCSITLDHLHRFDEARAEYDRIIKKGERLIQEGKLTDENVMNVIVRAYYNRALDLEMRSKSLRYRYCRKFAFRDYSRSIEIGEHLLKEDKLSDYDDLRNAYFRRSLLLHKMHRKEESDRDMERNRELGWEIRKRQIRLND